MMTTSSIELARALGTPLSSSLLPPLGWCVVCQSQSVPPPPKRGPKANTTERPISSGAVAPSRDRMGGFHANAMDASSLQKPLLSFCADTTHDRQGIRRCLVPRGGPLQHPTAGLELRWRHKEAAGFSVSDKPECLQRQSEHGVWVMHCPASHTFTTASVPNDDLKGCALIHPC